METEEKGGERRFEKRAEELTGLGVKLKLKRGYFLEGKRRGGNCSTPSPTWRHNGCLPVKDFNFNPNTTTLSARKLGANLWEVVQPHFKEVINMNKGGQGGGTRVRHNHRKDKGGFELPSKLDEHTNSPPEEEPATVSILRRHVNVASLTQDHQSVKRNGHPIQPASPASYSSSMEMAPYNPAITPTSSLEFKGRIGESSYRLKTSTELLKVLNRIWSLEERYASSISLVKALKRELDHCRAQNKVLLEERRSNRQEKDGLMKQISEGEFIRKNKEQDQVNDAVQSVRNELDNERKLRKRSESLHSKLARELSDMKSSSSNALKELKRERKARILLEDLCDEFAKGIRDYEREVRFLKHKPEKDRVIWEHPDRLILHISETWLDERIQMKLAETRCNVAEKNTIVDNLNFEIETFLRAKESVGFGNNDELSTKKRKESSLRRRSLESFHSKDAASGPRKGGDGEDSMGSGSHSLELNRGSSGKQSNGGWRQHWQNAPESHLEETLKSYQTKKKVQSQQVLKGRDQSSSQMLFEEHIPGVVSCNGGKTQLKDGELGKVGIENPGEVKSFQKLETSEVAKEGLRERSTPVGAHNLNSNHIINHSSRLEGGEIQHEHTSKDPSAFMGQASPLPQWMSKLTAPDPEVSESSKWPPGVKENTLKAKLLEARLEGRQSRSKTCKGSS